jgi:hypothetical protein
MGSKAFCPVLNSTKPQTSADRPGAVSHRRADVGGNAREFYAAAQQFASVSAQSPGRREFDKNAQKSKRPPIPEAYKGSPD